VRHDAEVAVIFDFVFASHGRCLSVVRTRYYQR
jgi:hypothetical protein